SDVNHGEDGGLVVPRVNDIEGLNTRNENHGVRNIAEVAVLLSNPSGVEQEPTEHAGTQLHEYFDIYFAYYGKGYARIKLATNVPIVYQVTSLTTSRKLAL